MLGRHDSCNEEAQNWPHRVPEDSFYGQMGAVGDQLFTDDEFADMYCLDNGRPSLPPSLMSGVLLLQFHDNVSDDEAAQRVLFDLRWKVALHLPLDYLGFDGSSLSVFRKRLRKHGKERLAFDRFVEVGREAGFLPSNAEQLIDSAAIKGAGAVQDTYTLIRSAMRKLLRAMGYHLPQRRKQLAERLLPYLKKTKPDIDWYDPQARAAHLKELVTDAEVSLELALAEADDDEVCILGWMLAKILGDDLIFDEQGNPQIAQGVAKDRIISTTDEEMRHSRKSASRRFDGHRLEVSEHPDSELLTNVDVIAGNGNDGDELLPLLDEVGERYDIHPERAIADGAYGSADNRVDCGKQGIDLVSRLPDPPASGLFHKTRFDLDVEAGRVTCPAGQVTTDFAWGKDNQGRPVRRFFFPLEQCTACPLRPQCTKAQKSGRTITEHFHETVLQKARQRQATAEFRAIYRRRAIVERKIAELMGHGLRKARYIGRHKTKFQALWTGAVVNLKRLFKLMAENLEGLRAILAKLSARRQAAGIAFASQTA